MLKIIIFLFDPCESQGTLATVEEEKNTNAITRLIAYTYSMVMIRNNYLHWTSPYLESFILT
jgi:hypothetical protein